MLTCTRLSFVYSYYYKVFPHLHSAIFFPRVVCCVLSVSNEDDDYDEFNAAFSISSFKITIDYFRSVHWPGYYDFSSVGVWAVILLRYHRKKINDHNCRAFVPKPFRTLELSFPGTFVLEELSFSIALSTNGY